MQACRANILLRLASMLALAVFLAAPAPAQQAKTSPGKQPAFDASACYGCHAPVKEFHARQQGHDAPDLAAECAPASIPWVTAMSAPSCAD